MGEVVTLILNLIRGYGPNIYVSRGRIKNVAGKLSVACLIAGAADLEATGIYL
jgi:hypothetical protein